MKTMNSIKNSKIPRKEERVKHQLSFEDFLNLLKSIPKKSSKKDQPNPANNIIDHETNTEGYFKVSENPSSTESLDKNEWFI